MSIWSSSQVYWNYIEDKRKAYLAEYFARRDAKKPPPKPCWNWRVNKLGTFSITIRKRKPAFLYKSEYDQMLKEMLASEHGLTKGLLDKTIEKRNIVIRADRGNDDVGGLD